MEHEVKSLRLDFVNAYLIKTKSGFILVDTGFPGQWEKLENQLREAGCVPGKLKLAIMTHGDLDHTGNALKVKDIYKTKIAMHPGDTNMVEKGAVLKRKVRPILFKIIYALLRIKRKLQKISPDQPRFKPDIFLKDGQNLDKYGLKGKVVHIPGHTPGSIGVLLETGNFISGDTLGNRMKPDSANFIENQEQLDASLEKIKKMKIKTVYPGHGKPFSYNDLFGNYSSKTKKVLQ